MTGGDEPVLNAVKGTTLVEAMASSRLALAGGYVLALKGTQETLSAEVEEAFIDADAKNYVGVEAEFISLVAAKTVPAVSEA